MIGESRSVNEFALWCHRTLVVCGSLAWSGLSSGLVWLARAGLDDLVVRVPALGTPQLVLVGRVRDRTNQTVNGAC